MLPARGWSAWPQSAARTLNAGASLTVVVVVVVVPLLSRNVNAAWLKSMSRVLASPLYV